MPVLANPQHEKFAVLMASGLSATKAYVKAGFSAHGARQSAHRLLANPDVSLRVAEATFELSKRTMDGIVNCRVANLNARLREWQDRWEEVRNALDLIIGERGEELGREQVDGEGRITYVAGGSTGFIMKDLRGKHADRTVYRIDPGILKLLHVLLDIGQRVAMELGQWTDSKRFSELEDEDIVRPDLDKLTDEEMEVFTRLFEKAAPRTKGP